MDVSVILRESMDKSVTYGKIGFIIFHEGGMESRFRFQALFGGKHSGLKDICSNDAG